MIVCEMSIGFEANASEVERLEVLPVQRHVLGELLKIVRIPDTELCTAQVKPLESTTAARPDEDRARVLHSLVELVATQMESD
eukprot:3100361-Rhodomonas_salina.2